MPKYRFTTDDGRTLDKGDELFEFRSDDAAAVAAQEALRDMARDALPNGTALDMTAAVEDEEGRQVYEASLIFRGKKKHREQGGS